MNNSATTAWLTCLLFSSLHPLVAAEQPGSAQQLRALIIDGQNNHDWKTTTPVLKWILEDSGRFKVTAFTAPPALPHEPRPPKGTLTPDQQAQYQKAVAQWKHDLAEAEKKNVETWKRSAPYFSDFDVL